MHERREPTSRAAALLAFVWLAACDAGAPAGADVQRSGPLDIVLVARREIPVPGRPAGLALVADAAGEPAFLATAVEQTGDVVAWPADAIGASRPLHVRVGPYPVGPLALPGGRFAVASMVDRGLRVFDLARLAAGDDRPVSRVELPAPPRRMAYGELAGRGAVIAVTLGSRDLALVAGDAIAGPFRLPTERSTALAFAEDGSGLWIGSQSPRAVLFVAAEAFADAGDVPALRHLALPGIPRAFAAPDFDGDGARVLHVLGGDRDLFALPDPRTDAPLAWVDCPAEMPYDADVADLDGDGRDELVVLSAAHSSYVVLGRPQGELFTLHHANYAGQGASALALGDLDGDGRSDLLVANRDSHAIALFKGRAEGQPGTEPFLIADRVLLARTPLDVALADFDGDGALEGAAISGAESRVLVLAREGRSLRRARGVPTGPSPAQLLAGDVDADGRVDLVVLERPASGATAGLLHGAAGDAAFTRRTDVAVDAGATMLALVRLDGAPALAWSDPGTSRVAAARAGEPARWTAALEPRPQGLVAWPSTEGRGDDELACWLVGNRAFLVRLARDGSRLVERERMPLEGFPVHAASGDVDGDGERDLVVLARNAPDVPTGFVQVLLSRGGRWTAGPRAPTGSSPQRVAVGDIDRDGRADVVVVAQNRHAAHVWWSREVDGAVVLDRQPEIGVGIGPMAVALGDVSGDGVLDIAVANAFSDDLSLVYSLARD